MSTPCDDDQIDWAFVPDSAASDALHSSKPVFAPDDTTDKDYMDAMEKFEEERRKILTEESKETRETKKDSDDFSEFSEVLLKMAENVQTQEEKLEIYNKNDESVDFPESFKDYVWIKEVEITFVKNVTTVLNFPESLEKLSLYSCALKTDVLCSYPGLSRLINLLELDLQKNKLTEIRYLPASLIKLNISKNPFADGSDIYLAGLTNLNTLEIEQCDLESMPDLTSLTSLVNLSVSENKLDTIDDCLPESVEELDISHNHISILKRLPSRLKKIRAVDAGLRAMSPMPDSVIEADISFNSLPYLARLPENLVKIDASNNRIGSIANTKLPDSLIHMDLTLNPLKSVDRELLKDRRIRHNLHIEDDGYENLDEHDPIQMYRRKEREKQRIIADLIGRRDSSRDDKDDDDKDDDDKVDEIDDCDEDIERIRRLSHNYVPPHRRGVFVRPSDESHDSDGDNDSINGAIRRIIPRGEKEKTVKKVNYYCIKHVKSVIV